MKKKVIKRILMCRPLHFTVEHVYNPWMQPGSVDSQRAMQQWEALVAIYKNLGITIEVIDQQKGLHDMVFATDQGIVQRKKVLLSNFRHKERQGESKYYETWFKNNGYEIMHLPNGHYLEGNGETYLWNDMLFIGNGYRSDKLTTQFLTKEFHQTVVSLDIVDPAFYHLDVGFFPLNETTIFYYPPAFANVSQILLQRLVPHLIPFTKEEAYGFCGNSIVTGNTVICQKDNPTFVKKLAELGYETREVDLGEFKKSGGGAHCLTNILEEVVE